MNAIASLMYVLMLMLEVNESLLIKLNYNYNKQARKKREMLLEPLAQFIYMTQTHNGCVNMNCVLCRLDTYGSCAVTIHQHTI